MMSPDAQLAALQRENAALKATNKALAESKDDAASQIAALLSALRQKDQQITDLRRMLETQQSEIEELLLRWARIPKNQLNLDADALFTREMIEDLLRQSHAALLDENEKLATNDTPAATNEAAPSSTDNDGASVEGQEGADKPRYPNGHPGRRRLPAHLERKVIVVDIPEDEKIDPISGKPLKPLRVERTERLDTVPQRLRVLVFERPVYALPDGHGFVIADLPGEPLPKISASTGMLTDIAINRFVDHMPYYRQAAALVRQGINWHRNLLDDWMVRLGADVLSDLHQALIADIRGRDYVGFDDTGVNLQVKGLGRLHRARVFVCRAGKGTGPPHVFFWFSLTKEKEHAQEAIGDFVGTIQADAAGNFDEIMARDGIIEAGCWAHLTRRFKATVDTHRSESLRVLKLIGKLFDIEANLRDQKASAAEILAHRQTESVALVDSVVGACQVIVDTLLPKSPLAQAARYCINQQSALRAFLSDGRIEIDNNAVERALRALGIGRKNWLFVGSERGGLAMAVWMSLIQSAQACGINPWVYIKDVLDRITSHPVDQLRDLLPGYWTPSPENTQLGVPVYQDNKEPDAEPGATANT